MASSIKSTLNHMKQSTVISQEWEFLVGEFKAGRTLITPLHSPASFLEWRGYSNEFNSYVEQVRNRGWRCMNEHEARAYLISTPQNKSIVWMSWLGYRGCRWHIVQHFGITQSKPSQTAKTVAEHLTELYQDKWASQSDQSH